MNKSFIYPAEPEKPVPRPTEEELRNHAELPENSLWFTHDPAIYHDPVSGYYYIYGTDALALKSPDLMNWTRLGKIVPSPSDDAKEWTGSDGIWAPDIVKSGDEYRLYCSNSKFGVQQSSIFLATSKTAEGPFIPQKCVFKSSPDMPVNAIDANIIEDADNGRQYMVYGSFWGGIHIIEIDKTTGYTMEDGIGKCIARRPICFDGAIEGPYIIFNPDNRYYYLFVSYGSLKNDYNIRVARSKSVTGPYVDHNGRDMTDLSDTDCTLGYMIACGYRFDDSRGWMGPGHNSVLHDDDGRWFLVHHIRPHNFRYGDISTMHIRQILWSDDGWPLASPEIYSGEKIQPVTADMIPGAYEHIRLKPSMPQGISSSVPMELFPDGRMICCSINGNWKLVDDYTLEISYSDITETLKLLPVWDYEIWKPTLAFTGTDNKHICIWGKKR